MNQKTGLAVIIMITLGIATVATGAILRQSTEVAVGLLSELGLGIQLYQQSKRN